MACRNLCVHEQNHNSQYQNAIDAINRSVRSKRYHAIAIDVGTKDPFLTTNSQLDRALTRLGVTIMTRFAAKVLPFFSENLTAARWESSHETRRSVRYCR